MKKFFILIIIFTTNILFSQKDCFESFHENGNLKSIECYNEKGERIGEWEYFHDNNQLEHKETYKNNYIKGTVIVYFRNGTINKKIKYSKKGTYRVEEIFNKQGVKISIQRYSKYRKDGKWINYSRTTKKIISSTNYKEGKKDGAVIFYNKEGKKSRVTYYKKDRYHGKSTRYYKNGQLMEVKNYDMNRYVGKQTYYYENGIVKSILVYGKDFKILNVLEINDVDGNPLDKGTLKDGTGIYYEYDNKGKVKRTFEMKDGNRVYNRKKKS